MAVWSIVKKSELEGLYRVDSEYYHPKYLPILNALRHLDAVPISEIAKPAKRGFKPNRDQHFDYIEISEVSVGTGAINAVKILGKDAPSRAQWVVRKGDVIISTVRPIRNAVALITEHENQFVCSSGFVVLKAIKVSPEFLFVYLKTKPVVQILDRKTTATMYPAVSWQDILSTPIFLPDKLVEGFVAQKVQEAVQSLRNSKSLYLQAEQMLLAELGLDKLDLSQPNHSTISLSQAQKVNRMDAEHFQPKYDRLLQHLSKTGKAERVRNILEEPIQKGVTPDYNTDGDIMVVNSQHLGRYCLNVEATERTTNSFWQQNRRARIKPLDVMVYATGAYIGRANTYLANQKAVAGVDIILARPASICNPLYLSVHLNCPAGLLQAEKFASGSGQRHIYPVDIARFMIYLPSMEFQQHIADLVTQSWQARQKATKLLEEAKKRVEDMIEGATSC